MSQQKPISLIRNVRRNKTSGRNQDITQHKQMEDNPRLSSHYQRQRDDYPFSRNFDVQKICQAVPVSGQLVIS